MAQAMKGSYILLIPLPEAQIIKVGSLPDTYFPSGYYAYVGSARGGFKSRLNRHLKENKKTRWHIDYLLQKTNISGITLCETEDRVECLIAQALGSQLDSIPGFGSSDCKCRSHLSFSADEGQMKGAIWAILKSLPTGKRIHWFLPETEGQNDTNYLGKTRGN